LPFCYKLLYINVLSKVNSTAKLPKFFFLFDVYKEKYILLLMFVMSLSVVQCLSCLPLDSRFGMFMDGYGAIVELLINEEN
jgi:hypothetical protein